MKNHKNKKVLLIDGENILHQSFHKFANLRSSDGKPSGAIFGFFKSLNMYLRRFDPDEVTISFDNGHSPYRTCLLPNYKGHRKNISIDYESLQSQKKVILKILKLLRVPYVYDEHKATDYEGDDLLAFLVLKVYNKDNNKITLISSDKDFNQLLGKNIKIFNPRKEKIIYDKTCMKEFGYSPEETVDYLSLVGDSSDDIPGVKGMGPVKTRKFLDKYGSIKEALKQGCKENIEEISEINKKLIDLRYFIDTYPLSEIPMVYVNKSINKDKFKKLCISYSLMSFLTIDFIKPFITLYNK